MRKIVFALSVVLTVMTACEDNHDSTVNGNRSTVPFSKIQLSEKSTYEAGVPTVTTTQTYSYSQGQLTGFTIVQSYSVQGEPMCIVNPEKPDVPINKNDAFQKVQKRRVQEKR